MTKRLTRKKLKQKDEFITTAERFINLAKKNRSVLVVAGIIILFTAIFGSIGFYYSKNYTKKGSVAYFDNLHLYNIALKSHNKADIKKAISAFKLYKENYKSLSISKLSLLYIANSEYMLGNYDKAIKTYNDFISDWDKKNGYITAIAYNGIVQAYIAKRDCKTALLKIDKLLNTNYNLLKQLSYLHAVNCYLTLNQPNKAIELLKAGIKKYNYDNMLRGQLINLLAYAKANYQSHIINFSGNNNIIN